ncbi:hydroxymethylbilane synthase [Qipengyuania sp. DGS5-3]|uniref:hydroxymethylbilane synthase n=1 Tax=Qipengyuania sp. DGS5-3 TaxID=3349632 RepID=UPI0036D2C41D
MTSQAKIRLGTRRSPLAMAQAEEVRDRLMQAHGWAEDEVEIVPVVASGDKITDRPLADIGGKALWTRELDQWLGEGRIDISVHSMKDVETLRPDVFAFAAILPREDVADVLLGAASIEQLPPGAVVGTSAPRRAAQLLSARPDCTVVSIRGNVATRMGKLAASDVDATFLAAAGLARLGETGVGTRLDPADWFPAPAQAAIGVECRADDERVLELLRPLDHHVSRAQVMAERALLEGLGGSCHSPIAVLTSCDGDEVVLQAMIYSPDGAVKIEADAKFAIGDLDTPRALAVHMLGDAPEIVRATFGQPE